MENSQGRNKQVLPKNFKQSPSTLDSTVLRMRSTALEKNFQSVMTDKNHDFKYIIL